MNNRLRTARDGAAYDPHMAQSTTIEHHLGLRAGDWVEVRSAEEILSTLDENASLDALPFMPEMLQFCGKPFRVAATAHKTCDTIQDWKAIRSMKNAVHLANVRCDGAAHGGCQATCLLFWKEAWLKRIDPPSSEWLAAQEPKPEPRPIDLTKLERATRRARKEEGAPEDIYRCQATEHFRATTEMRWFDPRHYIRDLTSGNVPFRRWVWALALAAYNNVMRTIGLRPWPQVRGTAGDKTPSVRKNIKVGELVRVKSREEIMPTLDRQRKNRGMIFDEEMLPFCGKTFRVQKRVERIIQEGTGRMMHLSNPCLILENVWCGGLLSRYRLMCQRGITPYWREIWLDRVDENGRVIPEPGMPA